MDDQIIFRENDLKVSGRIKERSVRYRVEQVYHLVEAGEYSTIFSK